MALKDLKVEEVLESLNITVEDAEAFTLDTFKESVGSKYILKDNIYKDEEVRKRITGKVLGSLTTKAAQAFGLTNAEVDGKPMEEIFTLATSKNKAIIEDLTKKAGDGNDKKVEDAIKQANELKQKLELAEAGLSTWEKKFNDAISESDGKLKSYKLSDKLGKIWNETEKNFIADYHSDKLKATGFKSAISEKYVFDLDEKDELVVKLKADGTVVNSKKKIGHAATPDEILLHEAEAFNIIKKNNGTPEKKIQVVLQNNNGGENKSKVHPNAMNNAIRA